MEINTKKQPAHVLNVGSNANNGANAGFFTANANNDSSNRNRNIGSQLNRQIKKVLTPDPLVEYVAIKSLVGNPNRLAGR